MKYFEELIGANGEDYSTLETEFKTKEKELTDQLNNNLRQTSSLAVKAGLYVSFSYYNVIKPNTILDKLHKPCRPLPKSR